MTEMTTAMAPLDFDEETGGHTYLDGAKVDWDSQKPSMIRTAQGNQFSLYCEEGHQWDSTRLIDPEEPEDKTVDSWFAVERKIELREGAQDP